MSMLEAKDASNNVTILLDGTKADITAGGFGQLGDIVLKDHIGNERIRLGRIAESTSGAVSDSPAPGAQYWGIRIKNAQGANIVEVGVLPAVGPVGGIAPDMLVTIGGGGAAGNLVVRDHQGTHVIRLDGSDRRIIIGDGGERGELVLRGEGADEVSLTIHDHHQLGLGGPGGVQRVVVDGAGGDLWLGGNGVNGDIRLLPKDVTSLSGSHATVVLSATGLLRFGHFNSFLDTFDEYLRIDAEARNIRIRGFEADPSNPNVGVNVERVTLQAEPAGRLDLMNSAGNPTVSLRAAGGSARFGGSGVDGDVLVFAATAPDTTSGQAAIWLRGDTGDIILKNADCAEDFEIVAGQTADPGTVMVIDADGRLRVCDRAYDRTVAGVVSGVGTSGPGIVLGRLPDRRDRVPIALAGRVTCKVDATAGAITVGDLLTTSPIQGHAMRADDPLRAFGAVLGKALAPLSGGSGTIPMLVSLQ